MIRYALKCAEGHQFESWFQSADAFQKLQTGSLLSCAVCGGTGVEKDLMAPHVGAPTRSERALTGPASPAQQALAELRRKIEDNADYVGDSFAAEARRIHLGEAPERMIYGEAKPAEARALLEDGVPVAPLPFAPGRKAN